MGYGVAVGSGVIVPVGGNSGVIVTVDVGEAWMVPVGVGVTVIVYAPSLVISATLTTPPCPGSTPTCISVNAKPLWETPIFTYHVHVAPVPSTSPMVRPFQYLTSPKVRSSDVVEETVYPLFVASP